MFDQSHGLRFDIYERIHLPVELPGIAELEEVELIPDIQVIQREDRAELYGQLLLTGLYRGEDDRTERLEHAIPVEITVPLTRVSSLEDIGVEIENFDIDLLTMRTVNITGVLSLRGIGGADTQQAWQQEEYTVAYSPEKEEQALEASADIREHETDALYENSLWTYGEGVSEVSALEQEETEANEAAVNSVYLEDSVSSEPADLSSAQQKDKGPKVRTHNLDTESGYPGFGTADPWQTAEKPNLEPVAEHFFAQREKTASAELTDVDTESVVEIHAAYQKEPELSSEALEPAVLLAGEPASEAIEHIKADEGFVSPDVQPAAEEKHDLKIAMGRKKEEKIDDREHLTFSSLLSSSRARKEQENVLPEDTAAVAAAPEAGNATEWKSRFIGRLGGADLFRKVRLCIVQREETLDTIAEKYQLSARELSMYNRLSGQNVEEGQVLYIP